MNVGLAPLLDLGQLSPARSKLIKTVLPYLSPEQTEGVNRPVDARSDFYGLGIVLYELLTGSPPFMSRDPMELMHHHLARQPMPPRTVNNLVPIGLSGLVLKLLAKTPDDRYQSAYGLRHDLRHCQKQIEALGTIPTFGLGAHDRSSQLNIPQTPYGRSDGMQRLLGQLEHSRQGRATLCRWCRGSRGLVSRFWCDWCGRRWGGVRVILWWENAMNFGRKFRITG